MNDRNNRQDIGVRDNRGRFVDGNPGPVPAVLGVAATRTRGAPEGLLGGTWGTWKCDPRENKQQIIERIMEVLLSPKTKPQDVVALARCMLEASRINLLAEYKTQRNQIN